MLLSAIVLHMPKIGWYCSGNKFKYNVAMFKTSILFVLVVAILTIAGARILYEYHLAAPTNTANWTITQPSGAGFEIRLPSDWPNRPFIEDTNAGTWYYLNSSRAVWLHGVGLPSDGMWVGIHKVASCVPQESGFVNENDAYYPNVSERTICNSGFSILLGLYNTDPQRQEHEQLLDDIANTFRLIN